ncbi:8-oxo-dGTP diphosphatase MutT [Candidatus Photodesmus blepharus]|uniref:8-oxo-dGTP diphosphatase MutT n=1 Tax=Candidatus Photodesmus blepharonis TaxID=1179155 RepID=UPI0006970BCF|nr:8-oxo-dGTP diphosphatase MutT [Candidatus Photodesmus blepharus]
MKFFHVVAAIILNRTKSKIFITKRFKNLHKGGYWEFPGGKIEVGENPEKALVRELNEEVGIVVKKFSYFGGLFHCYLDRRLQLDFFVVYRFDNYPFGKEGQEGRWVKINELENYQFPEANTRILQNIKKLLGGGLCLNLGPVR